MIISGNFGRGIDFLRLNFFYKNFNVFEFWVAILGIEGSADTKIPTGEKNGANFGKFK